MKALLLSMWRNLSLPIRNKCIFAQCAKRIRTFSSISMQASSPESSIHDDQEDDAIAFPENHVGKFGPEDLDVNWEEAANVWDRVACAPELPDFVVGDGVYGVTNLQQIQDIGEKGEFQSNSSIYTRHRTFALRIGYTGGAYEFGYQRQKFSDGQIEPRTVELDVYAAIRATSMGSRSARLTPAGRTDKFVSAVGQVINFVHSKPVTPEEFMQELKVTEPVVSGRLAFHDCARVPRQFNARSCATWRRYLYLVPLRARSAQISDKASITAADNHVIDVSVVDAIFRNLEGLTLPYNSFAVGEDRKTGEGMLDLCTLYRSRAYVVDPDGPSGSPFMCVELVGSRFLRRMVRLLVATAVREAVKLPSDERDVDCLRKICLSNDRKRRAMPFPGSGLCFAGVGFDTRQLSFYKMQRKVEAQALRDKYALEDEALAAIPPRA